MATEALPGRETRPARTRVTLENLTLGYQRHPAVHHLSGSFEPGSLTAVAGPNGAGKSTLLKGIAGILRPLEGRVRFTPAGGPGQAGEGTAYLPQQSAVDRSFPIRLFDLVALGLWRKLGAYRRLGADHRRTVGAALERMGLTGLERRPIGALSGGQMQRALLARLLLQDAPVILLDEPFNAIDEPGAALVHGILDAWQAEGRVVIAVLHDLVDIRRSFPVTVLLNREAIAWGPSDQVLTAENLARAAGRPPLFDEHAPVCRVPEGAEPPENPGSRPGRAA